MISISVNDLSLSFGTVPILDKVSFSLEENDKLGIIGVNGCGKSTLFRLITGGTVRMGALVGLQTAWSMVDIMMGLMTLVNLVAILLLSDKVFALLRNYIAQKREGKEPEFHRHMMPDIEKDLECWE